jgi:hypothetical protein
MVIKEARLSLIIEETRVMRSKNRESGSEQKWGNALKVAAGSPGGKQMGGGTMMYLVLINGKLNGHITPTKGLQHGDPLSPYFFLLCSEGLSTILNRAKTDGRVIRLPFTRRGTRLNHLFFTDDSLLFCKASMLQLYYIQGALEEYEKALGQKLNKHKTFIFFSRNTSQEIKTHILEVAEVTSTRWYEKYLGLPAIIGQSKVSVFLGIKGKV